jgi:hypothetical protein
MGLYETLTDETAKQAVAQIAKKNGINLELACLIYAAGPEYGEADSIKAVNDSLQAVRTDTLKGMKSKDQQKQKAELESKIDDLFKKWEQAGKEGRMADAIALKNRLNAATQKLKAMA